MRFAKNPEDTQIAVQLIKDLTEFMNSDDLVRMAVQCPELDFPIIIPFIKVAHLSSETILREIERVLQSNEQFVSNSSHEIKITHADIPSGVGNKCPSVDLDRFLSEKPRIINIQNKNYLCYARALVTAKTRLQKHDKWGGIRKGYKIQEQLAIALHHQANVPIRECGINDVKLFQIVMEDLQIHVVSKEHFNSNIYQGPEAENKIYPYYHDKHCDIITSMPVFLNRNY